MWHIDPLGIQQSQKNRVFILFILLLYDALVKTRQLLDLDHEILPADDGCKNNTIPESAKITENNT